MDWKEKFDEEFQGHDDADFACKLTRGGTECDCTLKRIKDFIEELLKEKKL